MSQQIGWMKVGMALQKEFLRKKKFKESRKINFWTCVVNVFNKNLLLRTMEEKIKNTDKIVQYWIDSSDKDFRTMQNLLKSGDNSWALFLGHLVLEKLLKAYYVKNLQKHPVFTHDLLRLATKAGLEISEETEE